MYQCGIDETVHRLYQRGHKGYLEIRKISEKLVNEIEVDRKEILNRVKIDKGLLKEGNENSSFTKK